MSQISSTSCYTGTPPNQPGGYDVIVKNSNDRFDAQRMKRRVRNLKIITLILGGIGVLTVIAAIILSIVGTLIMPVFPVVTVAALVKVALVSIAGAVVYAIKANSTKKKIQAYNANAKPIQNSIENTTPTNEVHQETSENDTESGKNPETDNPNPSTKLTPTNSGGAIIQPTPEPTAPENVTDQLKQLQLENLRQTLATQLYIQEQEFDCLNKKIETGIAQENTQGNIQISRKSNFDLKFQEMRYEHAIIAQHTANREKRLLELQKQWQKTFGPSKQTFKTPETKQTSKLRNSLNSQKIKIEEWLQQAEANQGWFPSSAKKQQLQDLKNAQKAYAEKLSALKPALESESQRRDITNKLRKLHVIKTQIEASKQKLDELARIAPEQSESDKQVNTQLRNHAMKLAEELEYVINTKDVSNIETESLDKLLEINSNREHQMQEWLAQRHTNEKEITEPIKAWEYRQKKAFDRLQEAQAQIFPQSSK